MPHCSSAYQRTLIEPVVVKGIGLHTGQSVQCRLCPAAVDTGRVFARVDLEAQPTISATLANCQPAHLSTLLQEGHTTVQTVEHVLAALIGLGVDNCQIEIDGPELPILDGSAIPFVTAILQAGLQAQSRQRHVGRIRAPITVWHQESFITAIPGSTWQCTYGIDFRHSPIQDQWRSWRYSLTSFVNEVAPARTFSREQDVEWAQQQGLIKGGSLDNAIVCSEDSWYNPLRFVDEPVRHKLVDLIGDLSLLGLYLQGHILAFKAGHQLHHQFARELQTSGALEVVPASDQDACN